MERVAWARAHIPLLRELEAELKEVIEKKHPRETQYRRRKRSPRIRRAMTEKDQEKRDWPPWWDWELDLKSHVLERMEDRHFTEVDLPYDGICGGIPPSSQRGPMDHRNETSRS